jgi:hypothetical protein
MLLFYLACSGEPTEPAEESEIMERPDDWSGLSEPDSPTDSEDIDQDGYSSAEDCDDWDPTISPAAEEEADGLDNDCDGNIDWDGVFSVGTLQLEAVGIYDAVPYFFTDACQGNVERERGLVFVELSCTVDQAQERANQLLGAELTVDSDGQFLDGRAWSDRAWIDSTGGPFDWDAQGDVEIQWSSLAENGGASLDVVFVLDALYLDLVISGELSRP